MGGLDSAVIQRTVGQEDEFVPGYHVIPDGERIVMRRWDQVTMCGT